MRTVARKARALAARLKPRVPKRGLLLCAALAWTTAGAMLGIRGLSWLSAHRDLDALSLGAALLLGLAFFFLVFARVSGKHIARIKALEDESPGLFSFFDRKAYLMMAIMISAGVAVRLSGLVDPRLLSDFYVLMGTPLLISSLRFYRAFARYHAQQSQ
jgi:hypothetical protein